MNQNNNETSPAPSTPSSNLEYGGSPFEWNRLLVALGGCVVLLVAMLLVVNLLG